MLLRMVRAFQTKVFARWARKERLSEPTLCNAIREAEDRLIEADLGGGLIKKRIAAAGRGKRGAYRTIIAYRTGEVAFFLYGFGKNERENIDETERKALKKLARQFFAFGDEELRVALERGVLTRIVCDD